MKKDFNNAVVGKLKVLQEMVGRVGTSITWYAVCSCGNGTVVSAAHLSDSSTRSCGCASGNRKHGLCTGGKITPEYRSFHGAKNRCRNKNNPAWPRYGGRGIEFRLPSFTEFLAYIGPRPRGHSLDRIDNDGHYEFGNIRWATASQQSLNQRPRRCYAKAA